MKKTISFVLVAFLILLGVAISNDASAQVLGEKDKTYVHDGRGWVAVPLNADGTDQVWVRTEFRCVCHWIGGIMQWMHMWYQFEFKIGSEEFIVKTENDYAIGEAKNDEYPGWYAVTFRCNIKGSEGTHVVASGTYDWWYGIFEIDKFIIQPKE